MRDFVQGSEKERKIEIDNKNNRLWSWWLVQYNSYNTDCEKEERLCLLIRSDQILCSTHLIH